MADCQLAYVHNSANYHIYFAILNTSWYERQYFLPPYNEWNILQLTTFINRLDYVTFKIVRKWDYDELYSTSEVRDCDLFTVILACVPVPVAARSEAYICGRSPAEIMVSNHNGGMDVCLLWVLCVVRYRSLRQADHSSRGFIQTVVRRYVWSRKPSEWGGPGPLGAVAPKTKSKMCVFKWLSGRREEESRESQRPETGTLKPFNMKHKCSRLSRRYTNFVSITPPPVEVLLPCHKT